MNIQTELSKTSVRYLEQYHKILEYMICGMHDAELTDSISHNFIVQMIPHHKAAIEMSVSLLKYTTWIPLQNIAENIIMEQRRGVANMTAILENCCQYENTEPEQYSYLQCFRQIAANMFYRMENACEDNSINGNFIREMIPHHEGAIQMAENALNFPLCPELVPILQSIITSQRAEVREMQRLECILCRCSSPN